MSPDDLARALVQPGRASIPYLDRYSPDRPLVLECFRPQGHNPDKPVVIVQHGMSRNGGEYCEAWCSAAEEHGFLIVAITFSKEAWPDAVTYNNGHVLDKDGSLRPRECWSLAIPGRVFALLREAGVTRRDKTYLWGHSAGGQFVHRYWPRSRTAFSRRSEPPIPAGIRCRRSTFTTPTGSAASG